MGASTFFLAFTALFQLPPGGFACLGAPALGHFHLAERAVDVPLVLEQYFLDLAEHADRAQGHVLEIADRSRDDVEGARAGRGGSRHFRACSRSRARRRRRCLGCLV